MLEERFDSLAVGRFLFVDEGRVLASFQRRFLSIAIRRTVEHPGQLNSHSIPQVLLSVRGSRNTIRQQRTRTCRNHIPPQQACANEEGWHRVFVAAFPVSVITCLPSRSEEH